MPEKTKVNIPLVTGAPLDLDPVRTYITTPKGESINAEQAALAYDALKIEMAYAKKGWDTAYTNAQTADTHRCERDAAWAALGDGARYIRDLNDAKSQVTALRSSLESVAKVGLAYERERDEARAELAKLKAERETPKLFAHPACEALAYGLSEAARDYLPVCIKHSVIQEESDAVPTGSVEIVIRTNGPAKAKPAPYKITADTLVTLGMLRDLAADTDTIARHRGAGTTSFDGAYKESAFGHAVARKLGR